MLWGRHSVGSVVGRDFARWQLGARSSDTQLKRGCRNDCTSRTDRCGHDLGNGCSMRGRRARSRECSCGRCRSFCSCVRTRLVCGSVPCGLRSRLMICSLGRQRASRYGHYSLWSRSYLRFYHYVEWDGSFELVWVRQVELV